MVSREESLLEDITWQFELIARCPVEFLTHLFDSSDFPPRWRCGNWSSELGWLHILSDLGVWTAYLAIPCVLGYFVLRRKEIPFRTIFWLFCAFILLCGTTHLMDAIIFWWPAYRLAGVLKLLTALIFWATVIALIPITPRALAMRSPQELEREIAERKRTKLELSESEERFRGTFENAAVGIAHTDLEGRWLCVNEKFCTILGYTVEELSPLNSHRLGWRALTYPEDLPASTEHLTALLRGEQRSYSLEKRYVRKDGSVIWGQLDVSLQRDAAGQPAYVIAVVQDISERKRLEDELQSSEQRRRLILDNANDAFVAMSPDGLIAEWNRQAEIAFGWPRAEVIGRILSENCESIPQHLHVERLEQGVVSPLPHRLNGRIRRPRQGGICTRRRAHAHTQAAVRGLVHFPQLGFASAFVGQ
jgi:PAS domain S-box-containing protein